MSTHPHSGRDHAGLSVGRWIVGIGAALLVAGCSASAGTPTPLASASPAVSPGPSPSPAASVSSAVSSASGAPTSPTAVTYEDPATGSDASGMTVETVTVRWTEADATGVTMKVYAVTSCPTTVDKSACVVAGMTISDSDLVLLQEVPASAGLATWTSTHEDIGGAIDVYDPTGLAYEAILLVASNAQGTAPFVVAATGQSCVGCTY